MTLRKLAFARKQHEALRPHQIFLRQRQAFLADPMPDAASRIRRLNALRKAIVAHRDDLVLAMSRDFGHRADYDSLLGDILPAVNSLRYCARHVRRWMRPERRRAGMLLLPARVRVVYQPLGVVGIIVPWNFPLMLSAGPLAFALAAGNRAMIKMSEFTPATNKVLGCLMRKIFREDEVALIDGSIEVAQAFSRQPFDHLLFTGSTAVGRHVMHAAADNLTPVTLELGGKSPVIIDADIPMDIAVARLILGKCMNAGQICIAPDYVLLPKQRVDEFVAAYTRAFADRYGNVSDNPDYTSIINEAHFRRIQDCLKDARDKGAVVIDTDPGGSVPDPDQRKLATQLVLKVTDDMMLMQQEIFGPVLPLVACGNMDQAIEYIQQRPRPLALYLMSFDRSLQRRVLAETHSGGVCINDTLMHVSADDAPFGGIGPSGMGQYHGREGFLAFSKAKTVLKRGCFFNTGQMAHPPYGTLLQRLLLKLFLR